MPVAARGGFLGLGGGGSLISLGGDGGLVSVGGDGCLVSVVGGDGLVTVGDSDLLFLPADLLSKLQPFLLNQVLQAPNDDYRVIIRRHNGDQSADTAVVNNGGTKIKDPRQLLCRHHQRPGSQAVAATARD
jgi:hypothetical protein